MTRHLGVAWALLLILLPPVALLSGGCSPHRNGIAAPGSARAVTDSHTLIDARGDRLTLSAPPERLISLAPSITEILYKLDLQGRLVADTTSCDYPAAAKALPHLDALNGSAESLLAHSPDLVIGMDRLDDRLIAEAKQAHIPTLVVKADTLQQTYDTISLIGGATGSEARAARIVSDLRTRIEAVKRATAPLDSSPSVMMMYGVNPIYTTGPGSFIDDIIVIAGGHNVVDRPQPGDTVSPEWVIAHSPRFIISSAEVAEQAKRVPGWLHSVPAVQYNGFYVAEDALVRPGPRIGEAAERLARFLHPGIRIQTRPEP